MTGLDENILDNKEVLKKMNWFMVINSITMTKSMSIKYSLHPPKYILN